MGIHLDADTRPLPAFLADECGKFVIRVFAWVLHQPFRERQDIFIGKVGREARTVAILRAPKPDRPLFLEMNENALRNIE